VRAFAARSTAAKVHDQAAAVDLGKTGEELHRVGAIDKLTMREPDVMCLTMHGPRESGVSRPKRARCRARESRDPGR
jgi:hypothetical protein